MGGRLGGMGLGEGGKRVNGERRREGSSIKRGSEWRVGEGGEHEWREEEGGEHKKDREERE